MKAKTGTPAPAENHTPPTPTPTPGLDALIRRDPDLVDRMFDYLLNTMPDLRDRAKELAAAQHALRTEFKAQRGLHIRAPDDQARDELRRRVLEMPDTRGSVEISRTLGIPVRTVRRWRAERGHVTP